MSSVQCTVHCAQYIVLTVKHTVHVVYSACSRQCTVHSAQRTVLWTYVSIHPYMCRCIWPSRTRLLECPGHHAQQQAHLSHDNDTRLGLTSRFLGFDQPWLGLCPSFGEVWPASAAAESSGRRSQAAGGVKRQAESSGRRSQVAGGVKWQPESSGSGSQVAARASGLQCD